MGKLKDGEGRGVMTQKELLGKGRKSSAVAKDKNIRDWELAH